MSLDTTLHKELLRIDQEQVEKITELFHTLREQVVETEYDDACTEITKDFKVKITLMYKDMTLMLTLTGEGVDPIFSLFNNKRLVLANFIKIEKIRELCQLTKLNAVFLKEIKNNEK